MYDLRYRCDVRHLINRIVAYSFCWRVCGIIIIRKGATAVVVSYKLD